MPIFFRRGSAFCIDYIIISSIWGFIDNLLFFPIPNTLSVLAPLVLFCIYFVTFEAGPTGASSPGKRIAKLSVVKDEGGHLTRMNTLDRSMIVGLITFVDWYNLPLVFPSLPVPGFLLIVLIAVQTSTILYNIWLCRLPYGYSMLQDRWTKTRVVRVTQLGSLSSQTWQRDSIQTASHYMGLSILFGLLLAGGLSVGKLTNQNLWKTSYSGNELPWRIRNAFEQQHGIRVRPEVTQTHTFSTTELHHSIVLDFNISTPYTLWNSDQTTKNLDTLLDDVKTLSIDIWVPYTGWNSDRITNYLDTALDDVTVEPGYFDSGRITLRTGIGLLSMARTFDLNLPE